MGFRALSLGSIAKTFSVLVVVCSLLALASSASAGTLELEVCGSWSGDSGPFQPSASPGLSWQATCGLNQPGLQLSSPVAGFHLPYNASAGWSTTAPAGIAINGVYTINDFSNGIGDGAGWWGEFYWDGGRSNQITDTFVNSGCCQAHFSSQHLGWFFACALSGGCSNFGDMGVGQLFVTATETRAPDIAPLGSTNLWNGQGWVRGAFPAGFVASDPSGVCSTSLILGSQVLTGPGGGRNLDAWQQCPDQSWNPQLDTRASQGSLGLGEGAMPLVFSATNAAGVNTGFAYARTVNVDNETPTIAMSGPTDAPSTAGTQYVTASAAAGPSGVSGIDCSLDGAPARWVSGASTQVPVAGIGVHQLTCTSANNARDASGNGATSAPATWTLSIRQPTVSGIGFAKLVDSLLCRRIRERVTVPARWVIVRRHHRRVRVRRRAHRKVVKLTRCHARIVRRRIVVWKIVVDTGNRLRVKRHKTIRVPAAATRHHADPNPCQARQAGHGEWLARVSGWHGAGRADGPRAHRSGQRARQLQSGDRSDDCGERELERACCPRARRAWSRLCTRGASTLEPSISAQVQRGRAGEGQAHQRAAHSGSRGAERCESSASFVGGYLPPGGALVRLRIGSGLVVHDLRSAGARDRATAASRRRTRSAPGRRAASSGSGSSWPPCRWGHIHFRRATRGSDPCSSGVTRRSPPHRRHHRARHRKRRR